MRSSTYLAAAFAAVALAKPVMLKRDIVTEVEYVTVYEYVTASGPAPSNVPEPIQEEEVEETTAPITEVVPVIDTPVEADKPAEEVYTPEPEPEQTPEPTPEPEEQPQPEPTSESAPIATPNPQPETEAPGPDASIEAIALFNHNIHRANHSAPDLKYDSDLAASAQALADTCVFDHNTKLGPASGYGQNLAASGPTMDLAQQISGGWYASEEVIFERLGLYGQADPSNQFSSWGHMTQLVWKSTERVGCAVKDCTGTSMGMWYTVCNYQPAGNFAREYANNVSPPLGNTPYGG